MSAEKNYIHAAFDIEPSQLVPEVPESDVRSAAVRVLALGLAGQVFNRALETPEAKEFLRVWGELAMSEGEAELVKQEQVFERLALSEIVTGTLQTVQPEPAVEKDEVEVSLPQERSVPEAETDTEEIKEMKLPIKGKKLLKLVNFLQGRTNVPLDEIVADYMDIDPRDLDPATLRIQRTNTRNALYRLSNEHGIPIEFSTPSHGDRAKGVGLYVSLRLPGQTTEQSEDSTKINEREEFEGINGETITVLGGKTIKLARYIRDFGDTLTIDDLVAVHKMKPIESMTQDELRVARVSVTNILDRLVKLGLPINKHVPELSERLKGAISNVTWVTNEDKVIDDSEPETVDSSEEEKAEQQVEESRERKFKKFAKRTYFDAEGREVLIIGSQRIIVAEIVREAEAGGIDIDQIILKYSGKDPDQMDKTQRHNAREAISGHLSGLQADGLIVRHTTKSKSRTKGRVMAEWVGTPLAGKDKVVEVSEPEIKPIKPKEAAMSQYEIEILAAMRELVLARDKTLYERLFLSSSNEGIRNLEPVVGRTVENSIKTYLTYRARLEKVRNVEQYIKGQANDRIIQERFRIMQKFFSLIERYNAIEKGDELEDFSAYEEVTTLFTAFDEKLNESVRELFSEYQNVFRTAGTFDLFLAALAGRTIETKVDRHGIVESYEIKNGNHDH